MKFRMVAMALLVGAASFSAFADDMITPPPQKTMPGSSSGSGPTSNPVATANPSGAEVVENSDMANAVPADAGASPTGAPNVSDSTAASVGTGSGGTTTTTTQGPTGTTTQTQTSQPAAPGMGN
ncbi:MAG: hypothetical protein P4M12_12420 [Gammaproteobacteria bacterium]|nr:hypothetical protein [Gammaproteobacteria bacterium]